MEGLRTGPRRITADRCDRIRDQLCARSRTPAPAARRVTRTVRLRGPTTNPTYLSGKEGYPIAATLVGSTATSGSATTLTDTTKSWTTNSYTGDELIITGGAGQGEYGTIASNTGTTLTLSGSGLNAAPGTAGVVAPTSTSIYEVGLADTTSYTAASLVSGAGTGNGPDGQAFSANNPEYSDQYVAKHFPFAWFESLSGNGLTTKPLTQAGERWNELRRQPHRQPRQPFGRPRKRPRAQHRSELQLDHTGQLQ